MNILFDVDNTLIRFSGDIERGVFILKSQEPIVPMIDLLGTLYHDGHDLYVASGGGKEYAAEQCKRLGILHMVTIVERGDPLLVDLSFDDQETEYGLVNCQVRVK